MPDNILIADKYFFSHPEKVLGEIIHTTNRFGDPTIKIKGTINDLEKIEIPTDITIQRYFDIADVDTINETKQNIYEAVIENEEKRILEVAKKKQAGTISDNETNFNVSFGSDFWLTYNSQINRDELEAFLYSQPHLDFKRFIDEFENTKDELVEKQLLFYQKGNFEYKWIYAVGDIYQKRQDLLSDKDEIINLFSEEIYENQLEFLNSLIPVNKKLPLQKDEKNTIHLNPSSQDAKLFVLKNGDLLGNTIYEAFEKYVEKDVPDSNFQTITKDEYLDFINGKNIIPKRNDAISEEEHNSNVRAAFRKIEIIKKLTNRILPDFFFKMDMQDRERFEKFWNKKYNKYNLPQSKFDGRNEIITKIPVFFPIAKEFAKPDNDGFYSKLILVPQQRNGIALQYLKKSILWGYGVGLGKTLTALASISQNMEFGLSKRPLVVAPAGIYQKWIKDAKGYTQNGVVIKGAIPHLEIVKLGNLNNSIVKKLRDYSEDDLLKISLLENYKKEYSKHLKDFSFFGEYAENIEGIYNAAEATEIKDKYYTKEEIYEKNLKSYLKNMVDFSIFNFGKLKEFPEKCVFLLTDTGLSSHLGIKNTEPFVEHLYSALTQGDKIDKADVENYASVFAKTMDNLNGARLAIEDLNIDAIYVDEVHNFKKIFTQVRGDISENIVKDAAGNVLFDKDGNALTEKSNTEKRETTGIEISSGTPSSRAMVLFAMSFYIHYVKGTKNFVGLSATPLTNSVLELYSIPSLINKPLVDANDFITVKSFIDAFIKIDVEYKIKASGEVSYADVLTGFNNIEQLRKFIFSFIDYRQIDKAEINKPEEFVMPNPAENISTLIKPNEMQVELMDYVQEFIVSKDKDAILKLKNKLVEFIHKNNLFDLIDVVREEKAKKKNNAGVKILQGIGFMKNISISPILFLTKFFRLDFEKAIVEHGLNYELAIEKSPKLLYILNAVKSVIDYNKSNNQPISSQIIFSTWGKEMFFYIKKYLNEYLNIPLEKIEIITGNVNANTRERIKKRFNAGETYILLGSSSIREGIDLQKNTSTLYMVDFDWNPTDDDQIRGRHCRQGNRHNIVRTVYSMLEDSSDSIYFQYLYEKRERLRKVWDIDGKDDMVDIGIDYDELRFKIITDPKIRVAFQIEKESKELLEEIALRKQRFNLISSIPEYYDTYLSIFNDERLKGARLFYEKEFELKSQRYLKSFEKKKADRLNAAKNWKEKGNTVNEQKALKKLKEYEEAYNNTIADLNEKHDKIAEILSSEVDKDPNSQRVNNINKLIDKAYDWYLVPKNIDEIDYSELLGNKEKFHEECGDIQFDIYRGQNAIEELSTLGYNFNDISLLSQKFQKDIEELETKLNTIKNTKDFRIEQERRKQAEDEKMHRTWQERLKEFEQYNFLLDESYPKKAVVIAKNQKLQDKEDNLLARIRAYKEEEATEAMQTFVDTEKKKSAKQKARARVRARAAILKLELEMKQSNN